MPSSNVVWEIEGSIGTLTLNRAHARNALTWEMYDTIVETCDVVETSDVRVFVIRGAGGVFSAGTDITQFRDFQTGADGVAYERRLDTVIDRLERVNKITMAVVDGAAVGGGCALALACDLRICSERARFGVPVARTLGNCLSAANVARLVDLIGAARALDLLLTARLIDGSEALQLGLATRMVASGSLDADVARLAAELTQRASSTVQATKAIVRRLREQRRPAPADDIIATCYASREFREGVAAFLESRPPAWH
jgi:enoyl-CoA hydratase/carnithine racemase